MEKKLNDKELHILIVTMIFNLLTFHLAKKAHRDFKPENILYFKTEMPWKISDFGLTQSYENYIGILFNNYNY